MRRVSRVDRSLCSGLAETETFTVPLPLPDVTSVWHQPSADETSQRPPDDSTDMACE